MTGVFDIVGEPPDKTSDGLSRIMSEVQVTVKLFGAFRKYGTELKLSLPKNCLVSKARQLIAEELKKRNGASAEAGLVYESALASETEILRNDCELDGSSIALLPPVCGG